MLRVLPTLILLGALVLAPPGRQPPDPGRPEGSDEAILAPREAPDLSRLPLYFIENRGQADPRTSFYLQGGGASVFLTEDGLRLSLADRGGISQRWGLHLDFAGASPTRPVGRAKSDAIVSYFQGGPESWVTGVPTYSEVLYRDLWPGIDLAFSGKGDRLKYDFLVRPGADPSQIHLRWRGATSLALAGNGGLLIRTPAHTLADEPPVSYQAVDGRRVEVTTSYALRGSAYGFELGAYDPSRPLLIDPALVYAGFLEGGQTDDDANGIAVDEAGAAYVVGRTGANFPVTVGPDLTHNGYEDTYVVKVTPDGTDLVYAGYIGGDGLFDTGHAIAVDGDGAAYVTGRTSSTEVTSTPFPVTVGPDLTHNGGLDAFVAKVLPDGTGLAYAGYVGGAGDEEGWGIAVDGSGAAYLTGQTDSAQAFPVTVGPDLTYGGGLDAFVAKVLPDGTGLAYAAYVGGAGLDIGRDIAADGDGGAYVTGYTASTQTTFPVTVGPDLTYNGGVFDAFVAKVERTGSELAWAGYIGGSSNERALAIAVDAKGATYVTGATGSSEATFPVRKGPDMTHNGSADAFLAKVKPNGKALAFAGYVGGAGADTGSGVAVGRRGSVHVSGITNSTEATFPVKVGPDLTYNGGSADAFVAQVTRNGKALIYAGYIGGSAEDHANDLAADELGNAYVAGLTYSTQATFPVIMGPDLTYGGEVDGFVAKVETAGV